MTPDDGLVSASARRTLSAIRTLRGVYECLVCLLQSKQCTVRTLPAGNSSAAVLVCPQLWWRRSPSLLVVNGKMDHGPRSIGQEGPAITISFSTRGKKEQCNRQSHLHVGSCLVDQPFRVESSSNSSRISALDRETNNTPRQDHKNNSHHPSCPMWILRV